MNIKRRLLAVLLALQIVICNGGVSAVALEHSPLGISGFTDEKLAIGASDLPLGASNLHIGMEYVWVEDSSKENGGYYVLIPVFEEEDTNLISANLTTWQEDLQQYLNPNPPTRRRKRRSLFAAAPSPGTVNITQLAADNHVLALDSTKKLYGWGDNTYGQLGLGSTAGTKVTKPTRIPYFDSKAPIKQIAAGKDVSYVLLVDGSVYEAGKGKTNAWTLNTQLSSLGIFTIYTKESCDYALALTADDTLYYWGDIPGNIGDSPVTSTRSILGSARIDQIAYSANYIVIKHTDNVVDGRDNFCRMTQCVNYLKNPSRSTDSNYFGYKELVNGIVNKASIPEYRQSFVHVPAHIRSSSDGDARLDTAPGGLFRRSSRNYLETFSAKINHLFAARSYFVNWMVTDSLEGYGAREVLTVDGNIPSAGKLEGYEDMTGYFGSRHRISGIITAGDTLFYGNLQDDNLYAFEGSAFGCSGTGSSSGVVSKAEFKNFAVNPVKGITWSSLKTIIGGRNTNYFLKTDGTVWAAGNNAQGQLGQGDSYHNTSSNVPLVLEFVVPPEVSSVTVSDEWGLTNTATITAVDTGNGLKEYAISTQNTAPIDGWQSSPTFTVSANGIYYAFVRDNYNTQSSGKEFRVNKVDRDKPAINNVSVPDILATSAKVNVAASDIGSGVKDYAITSSNVAPGTGWQSSPNFEIGTNGTYYAWVRDNVLNVSESRAFQINKVDGVKPTVTNVLAPTPLVNGRNEYTIVAVDNVGVTGYAMTTTRSAPSTGWQTSNKIPITENGTYFFWAKDLVGNISSEYMEVITKIPYRLTIAPTPHGSITTAKKEYAAGDEVELTIHADKGYRLKANSLKENGRNIYNDIFLMRAANTTVTAEFEPIPYPVKTVLVRGGSIEVDKPTAFIGDTVTVTCNPDKGYRIKENSLVENGRPITGSTFIMQPESTVVSCSFEPILYDITVQPTQHGTVKASAAQAIVGEKITLTVAPSEGYRVIPGSVKINGVSSKENSFTMPAEPVTVTAAFEPILYDVTITPSTHGKVTADRTTAIIGDTVNVTVVPDSGYRLVAGSLKVGTEEIKDTAFVMKAKNAVITAQFEPIVYTVTVADTPHGKISTSKATAIIGEEITISAVPNSGYKPVAGSIKVNGTTVEGSKFIMSAENAMVTGSFEAILYNIELKQSEHGTVTANKTTATIGETVKLTLTPDKGYRLKKDSLQVDGKPIAGTTFTMSASSAVVTVQWEAISYNVTITPSHNGTVTADKTTAVIGETVELSVKPAEGYKLVSGSIKVNGQTVENSFAMKAENAVITAEFEPVLYSLSLLQSPHGTITADKTTASIGDTVNLTITPDSGYRLKKDSLRANGQRVTGSSFVMTAANTAIKAEFEAVNLSGTVRDSNGNPLPGITVILNGKQQYTTATDDIGNYTFTTVPNDSYTIAAKHYMWNTATAEFHITEGLIDNAEKLQLICTRDHRLDVLEAFIQLLPEPLESGTNDTVIQEKEGTVKHAKKLYDELSQDMKKQLNLSAKNKLDKLLIRLAVIESLVKSNLPGVTADGLDKVIDKSDIVSVDGESAGKIKVTLQVDKTENPKDHDKEAITRLTTESEKVGDYLDINLFMQIDDKEPTRLTEISSPVTVSLPISSVAFGTDYKVVRVHNGVAEELETTVTDNIAAFRTDKFSTYALIFTPIYTGSDDDDKASEDIPANIPTLSKPVAGITSPKQTKPIHQEDTADRAKPEDDKQVPATKDTQQPVSTPNHTKGMLLPLTPAACSILFLVLFILVMCILLLYYAPIIRAKGQRRAQRWLEQEEKREQLKKKKLEERERRNIVPTVSASQVQQQLPTAARKKYRVIKKLSIEETPSPTTEQQEINHDFTEDSSKKPFMELLQEPFITERNTETVKKTLKDFIEDTEE